MENPSDNHPLIEPIATNTPEKIRSITLQRLHIWVSHEWQTKFKFILNYEAFDTLKVSI